MDIKMKYKIVEKIIQSNDDVLLSEIKSLVGLSDGDFLDKVPYEVKKSVDKAKDKRPQEKAYSVEKIRETHKQAYFPWTIEDDNKLELLFCEGKKVKELAEIFGRNTGAINSRIKKLELREKY